ncbi:MAG: phosphoribosylanthranilate isomerase [Elusimicrobiota bacterium]
MAKIKICGITNENDAVWCAGMGVHYLGFNFWENSPRKVSQKMVKDVVSKLPGFVKPVGVFVNAETDELIQTVKNTGLKLVQLHGDETVEYVKTLGEQISVVAPGVEVIKAFRVQGDEVITSMEQYKPYVKYFLLDAYVPGVEGGTGEVFNWDIAVKAKILEVPIFLAGGLNPDNVAAAVEKVDPFAVDVASGVERLPRRKDYDKLKQFILRCQC